MWIESFAQCTYTAAGAKEGVKIGGRLSRITEGSQIGRIQSEPRGNGTYLGNDHKLFDMKMGLNILSILSHLSLG